MLHTRFAAMLVMLSFVLHTVTATAAPTAERQFTMAVFPFMPVANIEGLFGPLAQEISNKLGKPLILVSAGCFKKFSRQLGRRAFDIAYVHPFDYIEVAKPAGYLPLAARAENLATRIVVKEGSPVRSLRTLRGRKLGNPPEDSTVSVLTRITLKAGGLDPADVKMLYFKSHLACMQQLVIGNVDACGVSPTVLRLAEQQLKSSFITIHESPPISAPLFVVRNDLPRRERDRIRQALTSTTLSGVDPQLRMMFMPPDGRKPFIAVTDGDYDSARKLLRKHEN